MEGSWCGVGEGGGGHGKSSDSLTTAASQTASRASCHEARTRSGEPTTLLSTVLAVGVSAVLRSVATRSFMFMSLLCIDLVATPGSSALEEDALPLSYRGVVVVGVRVRNSSVGSVLGSLSCLIQRRWFDPPLRRFFSGRGDFSFGANMGSDSIPPKNSFG